MKDAINCKKFVMKIRDINRSAIPFLTEKWNLIMIIVLCLNKRPLFLSCLNNLILLEDIAQIGEI